MSILYVYSALYPTRCGRWKLPVRVALVVVSIASELLDMVLVVSDARVRDGQEALSSSVTGASMMVLACSVLLLVVLPASFFLVNYPPSFFTRKGRGRRDWLRKLWLLKKKKGELDESEAEELVQKAKLRDAYDVSLALGTCIFHPVRSLAQPLRSAPLTLLHCWQRCGGPPQSEYPEYPSLFRQGSRALR